VVRPLNSSELTHAIPGLGGDTPPDSGVIARGLGRCYGDAAQRSGGVVVETSNLRGIEIDPLGVVTAAAGTTLDELLEAMVPRGWFVPVTPGTRRVTLGGMIAADVHGKNHHHKGSFGDHLEWIDLLRVDGVVQRVSPGTKEFQATCGGMGLTGVILGAAFRALPIETSSLLVDTLRTPDLEGVLAEMSANDHRYDYSVAWLDLTATGAKLGRSVLTRGRFATLDELARMGKPGAAGDPLRYGPTPLVSMPPFVPARALNRWTTQAFNAAWYLKAPKQRLDEVQSIGAFFHPLDLVREWNRAYGPGGFLQWQCVIPDNGNADITQIVERLVSAQCRSFLTVLKRFGPGNSAYLSFPIEGWTLTVDVPAEPAFAEVLDDLDRRVADLGGRLYFAKDSRMAPELVPVMYPRIEEFRAVANRLDPDQRLASDLSTRLRLR
jgi:decaprenylphospho-beta-D-ribofuranose 2-oxidase